MIPGLRDGEAEEEGNEDEKDGADTRGERRDSLSVKEKR